MPRGEGRLVVQCLLVPREGGIALHLVAAVALGNVQLVGRVDECLEDRVVEPRLLLFRVRERHLRLPELSRQRRRPANGQNKIQQLRLRDTGGSGAALPSAATVVTGAGCREQELLLPVVLRENVRECVVAEWNTLSAAAVAELPVCRCSGGMEHAHGEARRAPASSNSCSENDGRSSVHVGWGSFGTVCFGAVRFWAVHVGADAP
jgi:hypothetical protein